MDWTWIPRVSVGPFRFGETADDAILDYGLRRLEPDCAGASWDTYEIPGLESRITIEDNKIDGVLCTDALYFKNANLIGMPLSEVRDLVGPEETYERNVGLGDAAHYDSLGLTLWIVDGAVRTATCGPPVEDDNQQ